MMRGRVTLPHDPQHVSAWRVALAPAVALGVVLALGSWVSPAQAAAASPASTLGGFAGSAAALKFTNKTTADGLVSNDVYGVYAVGSTVYAATDGGLSISTNGGTSFTNYTTINGLGSNDVYGVYATDDTIYAAAANPNGITGIGGVSISTNINATPAFTNYRPGASVDSYNVYGVYAVGNNVYAATNTGLAISIDGGVNFTNRTTGLGVNTVRGVYAVGGTVYAATPAVSGGLSFSIDGGANFTNKNTTDGLGSNGVNGVYAIGSTVYAATSGGLSISTDINATPAFNNYTTGLGSTNLLGVYAVGSTVYAATTGGLSVSTNGGVSFTNYSTDDSLGSNTVRGVYAVGGTVYAATSGGLSIGVPPLVASPGAPSIVAGATGTVTISSTALPLPNGTVVTAVSADTGVATVTSTFNASDGIATLTVTGVTPGTANVTFSAAGYANVGVSVTVTAPPPAPPAPPMPASAPLDVAVVASDSSADVSWQPPASSGSFPVSNYQVQSTPGSAGCLVPASSTACMIGALRNGSEYAVQVRALTGAGWGPWSDSVSVVPQPPAPVASMVIIGSRDGRAAVVDGVTTGMVGQRLTPWVRLPGQSGYTPDASVRRVNVAGDFTWQRQANKKVYVYFRADDGVRSNRVIIPAR